LVELNGLATAHNFLYIY